MRRRICVLILAGIPRRLVVQRGGRTLLWGHLNGIHVREVVSDIPACVISVAANVPLVQGSRMKTIGAGESERLLLP